MSGVAPPSSAGGDGLEPFSSNVRARSTGRPRVLHPGVRLNIRGRSILLRGLKHPPRGVRKWLLVLGPGLIATSAGNDAGGIATYSQTGAHYGYELIWVMILITVSLAVVQETCSRLGAATGRGLLDLVRERFGLGWAVVAVTVVLVANGGLVVSEFVGIGAAAELFGFNKLIVVPFVALVLWYLVVYGSYARVEKIFVLMTLVFLAYPIAAVRAHPDWGAVAHGAAMPTIHLDAGFITLLVGLMGTTITPYMQLMQQSSIVERGAARSQYGPERLDAYAGSIFSNAMSIFMIIATAATLHLAGQTHIESAADAAKALEPLAGQFASALFATGLFGASMLAGAVLPLATSYAVCEAFGFPKGVDLDFRRAPAFLTLFTVLIAAGAAIAMVPGVPVISLLLWIQILNGALLPIVLVFLTLLANDKRLMRGLANTRFYNVLGWGTLALVTSAVVVMLGLLVLGAFGIHPLGRSS